MIHQPSRPSIVRAAARRAFTIAELVVVISIIVLLILIAVPSFQSMVRSSEASLAEGTLQAALRAGRDAAIKSGVGNDAAVVFFFEPGSRTTAVVCVRVGNARVLDPLGNPVEREIFAAVQDAPASTFPRGWMIRGATSGVSSGGEWYGAASGPEPYRYQDDVTVLNWVFPETGFYSKTAATGTSSRSSFMIRFEGGTGSMVMGNNALVHVLAPRPSKSNRPDERLDPTLPEFAADPGRFVRLVTRAERPDVIETSLGRFSTDIVLARPVQAVALYEESKLASGLGVRLDRDTGTLYADQNVPALVAPFERRDLNRWISGDTNLDGRYTSGGEDSPEAKLFAFDRYSASLKRLETQ